MEVTEAGKYTTPFTAAEALIKIWESKAGERQARKEKQYQEFLEKPLIKIMLNDYNSLPDDRFKPSTFNIYYSRNIWDYESKYPELRI
jgi:hypothetical protein